LQAVFAQNFLFAHALEQKQRGKTSAEASPATEAEERGTTHCGEPNVEEECDRDELFERCRGSS
jgi:hypothetical protein